MKEGGGGTQSRRNRHRRRTWPTLRRPRLLQRPQEQPRNKKRKRKGKKLMAYGKMMEAVVNCHCYENADAATGSQPSQKEIEENHREKNEAAERESSATIPEPANLI
ncbi:hypothetical protein LXL04_030653 [Taraxacum kok-saghyz]